MSLYRERYDPHHTQHTYRSYVTSYSTYVQCNVLVHLHSSVIARFHLLDHISRQAIITPDNVAYRAQTHNSVVKASQVTVQSLDICLRL